MCSNNVLEKCGIDICTCTVRPKFEVGQIWEVKGPYGEKDVKYLRIISLERKSKTHPIVGLYSKDFKDEGVASITPDGYFSVLDKAYEVTKLHVPKKTMKQTLYLWQKPSGDLFLSMYLSYDKHNKIVAKKEIELTEGEGLDV